MRQITKTVRCKYKKCVINSYYSSDISPVGTQVIVDDDWETSDGLRVLFVGDYPRTNSTMKRMPFSGDTGRLLRSISREVFGDIDSFGFTYVTHCEPFDPEDSKTTSYDVAYKACNYCSSFIKSDIDKYKPDFIIGLGNLAAKFLLGASNIGVNKGVIKEYTQEDFSCPVLVTWHPETFVKSFSVMASFIDDLELAKSHLEGSRGKLYPNKTPYTLLTSVSEVKDYVDYQLYDGKHTYLSYDVETHNTNKKYDNGYLTMQFANNTKKSTVVPLRHRETPFSSSEIVQIEQELKRLFTTKKPSFKYWVTHGGKFEQAMFISLLGGVMFSNRPVLDTMAGAFLLDENRVNIRNGGGYKLGVLAKQFIDFDYGELKNLRSRLNEEPLSLVSEYGGFDVTKTLALFLKQRSIAKKRGFLKDWMKLLVYLYSPAFGSFAHMEYNGFYTHLPAIRLLKSKNSPILVRMRDIEHELAALPSVKKVNGLLNTGKAETKSLFGTRNFFNMNKTESKVALFHDVLKLDVKKSDKGNFQINKQFFHDNAGVHEVDLFAEYSGLKKLSTAYSNQIYDFVNPAKGSADCIPDSRVRPTYFLTGTVTGRVACAYPNLQQIPRADSKEKALIKNMFRANQPQKVLDIWAAAEAEINEKLEPLKAKLKKYKGKLDTVKGNKLKKLEQILIPKLENKIESTKEEIRKSTGCALSMDDGARCLVQLDYMANEVRWWAIFSQDENLSKAFVDGKDLRMAYRKNPLPEHKQRAKFEGDIHRAMASVMFGVPVEKVTKDQRQQTKTITFGWMFGRSTYSIANQLKPSQYKPEVESEEEYVDRIQTLCDKYATFFPGAAKWLNEIEETAQRFGYAPSLIGRRRHLQAAYISGDEKMAAAANRQARNSPIQSNASDAALLGIVMLQKYINKHKKDWLMINAVHDSCVVELNVSEVEDYVKVAEQCFTTDVMDYMTKHWDINFSCPLEVEFEVSQAPTHGWATVTGWDFSQPSMDKILEGCLDPTKALGK